MNNTIICETPAQIDTLRMLTLRGALRLELVGMKHSRGFSAYATVKREFGFKGDKASVLAQLNAHIEKAKREA